MSDIWTCTAVMHVYCRSCAELLGARMQRARTTVCHLTRSEEFMRNPPAASCYACMALDWLMTPR